MEKDTRLQKEIGLLGGVSLLTGIMVGSGIFFIGSYVLLRTEYSLGLALLVWLIGGIITLFSGLVYAELGTSLPYSGGYYVYLKEAYGKPVAFMSGFTNFILASSGSIAALSLAFGQILWNIIYTISGVMMPLWTQIVFAALVIIVLTILNLLGIKFGNLIQKSFLFIKAVPILIILSLGLILGTNQVDFSLNLSDTSFISILSTIGFAVIATFWAYEGWTNLNNVTEEMKNPAKDLPKSLIITILSVMALYTLYNYSIFRTLSIQEMQGLINSGNFFLGISSAATILGSFGMYLVMFTMLISVFGAVNGCIIAFPRVYYAMGKDGSFFKSFAKIHPKTRVPFVAVIASSIVALILLVFSLDNLVTFVAFGGLIFNTLIFASIFIFRKRLPSIDRPYKVFGYPFVPIITILVMIALLISTLLESPREALIGLIVITLALPIYYVINRVEKLKNL
ncbi:MAG: APC family permease [Candidatus Izemoplasmataceae bacterium]